MAEEYGNNTVISRDCQILKSIVEDTPYEEEPKSEEEYWLLKLKEVVSGGGGGSVSQYKFNNIAQSDSTFIVTEEE